MSFLISETKCGGCTDGHIETGVQEEPFIGMIDETQSDPLTTVDSYSLKELH